MVFRCLFFFSLKNFFGSNKQENFFFFFKITFFFIYLFIYFFLWLIKYHSFVKLYYIRHFFFQPKNIHIFLVSLYKH